VLGLCPPEETIAKGGYGEIDNCQFFEQYTNDVDKMCYIAPKSLEKCDLKTILNQV